MKILLIYPNLEGYQRVPLGFCLIMSYLLREGHQVELFDTTFIGENGNVDETIRKAAKLVIPTDISQIYEPHTGAAVDEMLKQKISKFSPDLIGVNIVEDNYEYADHLMGIAKSVDSRILIIAGGSTPSSIPDIIIENPNIDYLCEGEGEEFIVEFCDLLSRGKSVENVRNLWYKKNGAVKHNPLRPYIDMNTVLPQRLDLWDKRHFVKSYTGNIYQTGSFEMSRGCPNKCSYCVNERLQITQCGCGKYRREKSVTNLIKEIKTQKEYFGFKLIFFADDNFIMISLSKLKDFVKAWKAEINLPYWINTHLEQITEERLALLKDSGCCGIGIGLESGSEWLRANILHRRHIDNESIIKKFKLIEQSGIRVTANSMIGFPAETEADIFETIKLNKIIKPSSIDLNFVAPYAGTAIHKMALEHGYFEKYDKPGFRDMAKNITVRKWPVMKLPQITSERLTEIFYSFTSYIYEGVAIPEKFLKPAPGAHQGAPSRENNSPGAIRVDWLAEP